MGNQPNLYPNPGSYDDILKRMTRRMRENKLDDQIFGILQQAFEKELSQGNLMLSRPERVRLFHQVAKAIFTDVLGKIGGSEQ
jgi:hypothetical protein